MTVWVDNSFHTDLVPFPFLMKFHFLLNVQSATFSRLAISAGQRAILIYNFLRNRAGQKDKPMRGKKIEISERNRSG